MPGEAVPNCGLSGRVAKTVALPEPPGQPVLAATRRTMQANRGRDTGPEMALRTLLHRRGMRFRVDHPLPFDRRRRADIVFTRVGLYVFVDGCFWHGCPAHFVMPKTRREFWSAKIEANRSRDRDTDQRLRAVGYIAVRIWEHMPAEDAARLVAGQYAALSDAETSEKDDPS